MTTHQEYIVDAAIETKFWDRVVKTNACWGWIGAVGSFGYGQLYLGHGKLRRAHRVSWEIHYGPIPRGKHVCHHCDNPPCPRPDHLFIGTHADNMADKAMKGRNVNTPQLGEDHWKATITEADVIAMRLLKTGGMPTSEIANHFKMSYRNTWLIVTRRGWRHVL